MFIASFDQNTDLTHLVVLVVRLSGAVNRKGRNNDDILVIAFPLPLASTIVSHIAKFKTVNLHAESPSSVWLQLLNRFFLLLGSVLPAEAAG